MPNIVTESLLSKYGGAHLWRLGGSAGLTNLIGATALTSTGSPDTTAVGDSWDEVNTADGTTIGGDAVKFTGTTGSPKYISVPASIITAFFAATNAFLLFVAKRNTAGSSSAIESCGGWDASTANNCFAFNFNQQTTGARSDNYISVRMRGPAGVETWTHYNTSGQHYDGEYNVFGVHKAGSNIGLFFNGLLIATTPIIANSTPTTANIFDLGRTRNGASISGDDYVAPWTMQYLFMGTPSVAPTQALLSAWSRVLIGRTGAMAYGSRAETGRARAARLIVDIRNGVDWETSGDSIELRTSTDDSAYSGLGKNRTMGNGVATVGLMQRLTGRPLKAMHVGANVNSASTLAYVLGVRNVLVNSPSGTLTVGDSLDEDLKAFNAANTGFVGSATVYTGFQQDLQCLLSGSMSDNSSTGISLDPRAPKYPFALTATIRFRYGYRRFATGGGTIYPQVVRVSDGVVIAGGDPVSCTGGDSWAEGYLDVGRIDTHGEVRFTFAGASAMTSKSALSFVTIEDTSGAGVGTYARGWAWGGQGEQLQMYALTDANTRARLTRILARRRSRTGNTVAVVQLRQNGHLAPYSDSRLDLAYNDDRTQNALVAYRRAGVKSNMHALLYNLEALYLAAGYTKVWFILGSYHQNNSTADWQMESHAIRANLEVADGWPSGNVIVIDGVESGQTYNENHIQQGFYINTGSEEAVHLSLRGEELKEVCETMALTSGQDAGLIGIGPRRILVIPA